MRTTLHNGRGYGTRHNDRNFDVSQAEHIDPERSKGNIYRNCYGDPGLTFEAATLRFYEEHFTAQLERTNAGYIRNRHPERCKTMEQWMRMKQHGPEETILQIGDMNSSVPGSTLWACYGDLEEQLGEWAATHGNPFTVVSAALHVDEQGAGHIHQTRVWHYQDGDQMRIGQEKALQAAGVELPDPTKAPGRHNNRKMTFDRMVRGMWLEILRERGLQIEEEPLPDGKHNRTKEQMIRDKNQALLEENERLEEELQPLRELQVDIAEVDRIGTKLPVLDVVVTRAADLQPIQDQAKAYRVNRDEIQDLRGKEEFLIGWHDRLNDREAELDAREQKLEQQELRDQEIHQIAERAEQRVASLEAENASQAAEIRSLRSRVEKLDKELRRQFRTFQERLRGSYEAMTTVVKAVGIFQRNRLLEAVKQFAADQTRAAGFDDLASDQQHPGVSQEITQRIEPEQPKQQPVQQRDLEEPDLS